MRFSRSTKATALLLLVSLQYTFAALDVALCSSALCYPKVTGGKVAKPVRSCPEGFSMEKDGSGKNICTKRVAKACAAGLTLKDGRCCRKRTSSSCMAQPASGCPAGYMAKKDCGSSFDISVNKTGRHLLEGNPLVKELNIVGHSIVPNVILPRPAVSVNIAKPTKQQSQPKININGNHGFPQIILPEPKVSFTMPPMPKVGPEIKFEGHPSIMPTIIPVLPEPLVTVEVPKGGYNTAPKVTTDISQKKVTLDLSQLGPKHTLDVNLPALPDLMHQATKIPDIEINMPDTPKVIDLSGLGPKKIYNITLPQVKLAKQGSITFLNSGANEPQYLDLTHLGPKHRTGINVKLPSVQTNGATVNVIVEDDKSVKDTIVIPGHKEKHNTVINIPTPEKDWPEKRSKLVVDIAANPKLHDALAGLQKQTAIEKVNIKLPEVDLSKNMPAGKDVVIEMKPVLKFDHGLKEKPVVTNVEKRVNVEMKNITIPRLMEDKTILIKPLEVGKVAKHLLPKHMYEAWQAENAAGVNSTMITTQTIINMPNKTLPDIPVPKDKIDAAVSIPIKMGLVHNGSQPDGMINIAYKEEWSGGNPILEHPAGKAIKKAEHIIDAVAGMHCPTQCCTDVEEDVCEDGDMEVQTVEPVAGCEGGFSYDAKSGICANGEVKVVTCPDGMSKCHIDGKGVCVPSLDGKVDHDLCQVFKAVCHKGTIVAKSCT